jgi:hypothetical protein
MGITGTWVFLSVSLYFAHAIEGLVGYLLVDLNSLFRGVFS